MCLEKPPSTQKTVSAFLAQRDAGVQQAEMNAAGPLSNRKARA
jgi:hypothetical protein